MCPDVYDVVIDGYGYVTSRAVDPNLPFRVQQQSLAYSPTFVERQNVSNAYGDNAQDFFLTSRERDWSLGEQQKFFRTGNDGRYWMGSNVDVGTPGQVVLFPQTPSLAFSGTVLSGAREAATQNIVVADVTNLYRVSPVGAITSLGAHGLGIIPNYFAMCTDGANTYLTNTGGVGVRKWDGASFSTFSASVASVLAFLNNTLYGIRGNNNDLVRWDSGGVLTSLFTWKDAAGVAQGMVPARLEPFGGKLLILLAYGQEAGGELWIYDGSGASRLEVFPANFVAYDIEVLYGVAYISGSFFRPASSTTVYTRPAILFFDGSQIGILWEANAYSTTTISSAAQTIVKGPHPAIGVFDGKLIFTDDTTGNLMAYNPALGGVSTIGSYAVGGDSARVITVGTHAVHIRNQTTGYYLPASTYPASGYVISSLIDFESSLPKQFRGVKIEWTPASDGDGGSVDIAYQLESLTGSWTTLHTGAVSGTEYTFTNISGHAVAIKITINKGTSTAGPTLRSCSVRGAPVLTSYRINEFILDLGGGYSNPVRRRDDSDHNLTGEQMRANLAASVTSQSPLTVTDVTGTYTGILEPANCEFDTNRPAQYYARIRIREV
jgi:hypothetical protein